MPHQRYYNTIRCFSLLLGFIFASTGRYRSVGTLRAVTPHALHARVLPYTCTGTSTYNLIRVLSTVAVLVVLMIHMCAAEHACPSYRSRYEYCRVLLVIIRTWSRASGARDGRGTRRGEYTLCTNGGILKIRSGPVTCSVSCSLPVQQ